MYKLSSTYQYRLHFSFDNIIVDHENDDNFKIKKLNDFLEKWRNNNNNNNNNKLF